MTPSIQSALTQLRDQAGWYCGDQRAEKILERLVADTLAPVRAALNGDLQPTKDEETLAREMYHELVDARFACAGWKKKAEEAQAK